MLARWEQFCSEGHDKDVVGRRGDGRCAECARRRVRRHYETNRSRVLAKTARYRRANPEKRRKWNRLRDARKRVRFTYDCHLIPAMLRELVGDCCTYCGSPYAGPTAVDHVLPLSMDGSVHAPDYIVPCCGSCNSSRNRRPLLDWLREKQGVAGLVRFLDFEVRRSAWLGIRRFIEGRA